MNLSIANMKHQWRRVLENGWLTHFEEAAAAFDFKTSDLIGVGSRESNMGGRELSKGVFEYLTRPGDRGNAFGLMQADKRYFPDWVRTGKWRDARESIFKGAEILARKRQSFIDRAGRKVVIWNRAHTIRKSFIMPEFDEATLRRVTIAAYNCGDWAAYHAAVGNSIDQGTTGADYSDDVIARADYFQKQLEQLQPEPPTEAQSNSTKATIESDESTQAPARPAQDVAIAAASEPPKPTMEQIIQEASAVPGLKECGLGFARVLFGGVKKISAWLTGITITHQMITPRVVILAAVAIAAGFIYYTIRRRKKAKAGKAENESNS